VELQFEVKIIDGKEVGIPHEILIPKKGVSTIA